MSTRSRKTRILLVALLLALLLPYLWYRYQTRQAAQQLAEAIAELDRAAAPWRLADLEANLKPIPYDQNAALVVLQACPPFPRKDKPVLHTFKPPSWQQLTPDQIVALRDYLESVQPHLVLAVKLAEMPRGRFPIAVADGYYGPVPHIDKLTIVGKILQHDAWLRIQQGDFEQAAKACQAMLHGARTLREPRYLIDNLVRLHLTAEVGALLERLLAQGQANPKLLVLLQEMLLEEADFDGWGPAVAVERAGIDRMFENLASGKVDIHTLRRETAYQVSWPVYLRDHLIGVDGRRAHAWALRHCTEVLALQQLPPHHRLAKMLELDERATDTPEPARTFAAMGYGNAYHNSMRFTTRIRCAVVGLAAERFRQEHERWPQNIDELVPEFLAASQLDQYSGAPLKLRKTPNGLVVFSPGKDGIWQGDARDDPTLAHNHARLDHEFRLWNLGQRRK